MAHSCSFGHKANARYRANRALPARAVKRLTPECYQAKWGLPPVYPMVAPIYSEARSKLAKELGLGQRRAAPPRRRRAPPQPA